MIGQQNPDHDDEGQPNQQSNFGFARHLQSVASFELRVARKMPGLSLAVRD
jgi:hypothetical protein